MKNIKFVLILTIFSFVLPTISFAAQSSLENKINLCAPDSVSAKANSNKSLKSLPEPYGGLNLELKRMEGSTSSYNAQEDMKREEGYIRQKVQSK